jgi:hypothetical protein
MKTNQAASHHVLRAAAEMRSGRIIHVQMATIIGSSGHFTRRDHRKRVGAKSNIGTESKSSLYTSGESFRGNASQGLDAVKIGCSEKAVGSERGEIHRLPEETWRETGSETTVAARPGAFFGKVHVPEALIGFICWACSWASNLRFGFGIHLTDTARFLRPFTG